MKATLGEEASELKIKVDWVKVFFTSSYQNYQVVTFHTKNQNARRKLTCFVNSISKYNAETTKIWHKVHQKVGV